MLRYGPDMAPTEIPSIAQIAQFVGVPLGTSEWIAVDQSRIDAFATATGDHQWIHCDAERAKRESPYGTTIAHGFLTISLIPVLLAQLVAVKGARSIINTGTEKVKLAAPVPSGSRLRMSAVIESARKMPGGGVRVAYGVRFELEGQAKSPCIATIHCVYLG
jgi:acyl dehydratase